MLSILVTEIPIERVVNPVHDEKAVVPIVVTEFGIVTLDNPEHPEKALGPILTTEFPIKRDDKLVKF